jgi:hypothetical protein
MYSSADLKVVPIEDLRPTQMTLGWDGVAKKRTVWSGLAADELRSATEELFLPAVLGPGSKFYLLDGHHTALALIQEGHQHIKIGVVKDLSALAPYDFWVFLDHQSWLHCYDAEGRRRSFEDIPDRFENMLDDPYRTLAGQLHAAGGFAKAGTPFEEFLWANHLRTRISATILKNSPDDAINTAVELAHSKDSNYLPGWCGKSH